MKLLQLLPIGEIEPGLLQQFGPRLAQEFNARWEIIGPAIDPQLVYHRERQQYHSTELLAEIRGHAARDAWRVLGVAAVDLYIPILTFVFGEAQMGGECAVVSYHRLRQEFYGLPADAEVLSERLLKEAVHEIGHTLNLTHCDNYRCAMASSHGVEYIDLKEVSLCPACEGRVADVIGNGRGSTIAKARSLKFW